MSKQLIFRTTAISIICAGICLYCYFSPYKQAQTEPAEIIAVKTDTIAGQRLDFVIEELNSYRKFIEEERKSQQEFVTKIYATAGVIASLSIAILGWFGFKSLDDIKVKAREEYYQEMKELLRKKLSKDEKYAQILIEAVHKETLWRGAKILFIGELSDKDHRNEIEKYFERHQVKPVFEKYTNLEKIDFEAYDVVVSFYTKEKDEEQLNIHAKIVTKKVPWIAYTGGAYFPKETKDKLDAYPYFSPANNRISLLANIFDAFNLRISQSSNETSNDA